MQHAWYARHGWKVVLTLTLLCPPVLLGAYCAVAEKRTDFQSWLPEASAATRQYRWFRRHFGEDQFILASWDGCTLEDERLSQFADSLEASDSNRTVPRYFTKVGTGKDLIEWLGSQDSENVTFDRRQAIERLRGTLIGPDGRQTCAVVVLSEQGERHLRDAIDGLYRVAAEKCGISADSLHLGGTPIENRAFDAEGEWALARLASLSGAICVGLAWFCLRSWRLVAVVFLTSVFSALMSLAVVWYTGGAIDAVQLTMPSLVYVLTLSGAIHLINYYKEARVTGSLATAADRAVQKGWLPCCLAACTTAIGLLSLLSSRLAPVSSFGLYSAIGIIGSLLPLFGLLPAAVQRWPPGSSWDQVARAQRRPSVWRGVARFIVNHNGYVCLVSLVVLAAAGAGLQHVTASMKPIHLFSAETRLVRDYVWLEDRLGPLVPMEVVIRVDPSQAEMNFLQRLELVREVHRSIEKTKEVGGVISLATFVPPLPSSARPPPDMPSRRRWLARAVASRRLERHRQDFLATGYLAEGQDEKPGRELWRISARLWAMSDVDYGQFADELKGRVEPVLQRYREAGHTGISATYTGLVPLLFTTQRQLIAGLINSIGLAFVIISIMMVLVLRSLSAGMLTMIPNLLPVVLIFGGMGWLGLAVDLGSLLTASVAMGVAVDDTVHFVTWYRRARDAGNDRRAATLAAYDACAKAMFQTTLVGGLGLVLFALSDFMPTRRFGCLMFALLTAALVGDLVILPAILAGPAGRLFTRGRTQSAEPAHTRRSHS